MPVSVRLDDETRKVLDRIARTRGIARSEVIRRGIRLVAREEGLGADRPVFDELAHLIGSVSGADPTRSEKTGARFREMIERKRVRR